MLFIILIILNSWIFFSNMNDITIEQLDETGTVKITVKFFVPMKNEDLEGKIRMVSERPGTNIVKSVRWIGDRTLEIFAVEEGLPRGFKTWLFIEPLKTKIPGLYKNVEVCYRANVPPFLLGISPVVPSRGPLVLKFSTPIKKEGLKKHLKVGFEFTLKPVLIMLPEGKFFKDFSQWYVIPEERLLPGERCMVEFDGVLENLLGKPKKVVFSRDFEVASAPEVVFTDPVRGSEAVRLYAPVTVNFDQDMKEVHIKISGMVGDVEIKGRTATYRPHTVYMPGKNYEVTVYGKSIIGEEMEPYSFNFSTAHIGDKLWVEVNLRRLQKVVVYRGDKAIRSMLASGGLPWTDDGKLLGFFTIKDRGESFWSEEYGEGALYWVRIEENFLFHSLPRDINGNIIEEELKKLGIPASHGCIRLRDEDAKWFYENIPEGTMVVIHE